MQVKSTVAGVVGAGQDKAAAASDYSKANAGYYGEQAKAYINSLTASAKGTTADTQAQVLVWLCACCSDPPIRLLLSKYLTALSFNS